MVFLAAGLSEDEDFRERCFWVFKNNSSIKTFQSHFLLALPLEESELGGSNECRTRQL